MLCPLWLTWERDSAGGRDGGCYGHIESRFLVRLLPRPTRPSARGQWIAPTILPCKNETLIYPPTVKPLYRRNAHSHCYYGLSLKCVRHLNQGVDECRPPSIAFHYIFLVESSLFQWSLELKPFFQSAGSSCNVLQECARQMCNGNARWAFSNILSAPQSIFKIRHFLNYRIIGT